MPATTSLEYAPSLSKAPPWYIMFLHVSVSSNLSSPGNSARALCLQCRMPWSICCATAHRCAGTRAITESADIFAVSAALCKMQGSEMPVWEEL